MSSPPFLRPLGVGEILARRRSCTGGTRPRSGVVAVVWRCRPRSTACSPSRSAGPRQLRLVGIARLLQPLVLVVSVVASFLATAAAYRLVADAYLGRRVDPGASLRFALKRCRLRDLGLAVRRDLRPLRLVAVRRARRLPRRRLVGRRPRAAGREPARPPRRRSRALVRGTLVAVRRRARLSFCWPSSRRAGAHRAHRDHRL